MVLGECCESEMVKLRVKDDRGNARSMRQSWMNFSRSETN
jgi:hypothetical protein